ncbi:uracil-DNA glycosylase, partial [Candidatus Collierbacteria bacterium CG09_land_8_20_14_0_10_46_12]
QANGLAFAVAQGVRPPPSLQNIYKEIKSDLNCVGDINQWPSQGVLLLNSTLTVQAHQAGSHQNIGWEKFTGAVIRTLSEQKDHLVFILWGNYAKQKGQVIDTSKHLVISSPHPSPFSAYTGFFGSRPFSKCNAYLESHSLAPIDW